MSPIHPILTSLAALAMLASVSAAVAIPPPPSGYYGFFRQAEISCPTEAGALSVFSAMQSAKTSAEVIPAAIESAETNGCDIGFVPGPFAVGDSELLGVVKAEEGPVTFYSVHVGTSEKEWWVLYADKDGAK